MSPTATPTYSAIVERFLRYTRINTTADPNNMSVVPSSANQHILADLLLSELQAFGLEAVKLENSTVIATLPAHLPKGTATDTVPTVGWICHIDTHFDKTTDTHAQVVAYKGGDIVLNPAHNITMKRTDFPELAYYENDNIIVTDGTSLLGADNKSAIAEVMHAVQYFVENPEVHHAEMRIIFVPDEEIGLVGAKLLTKEQINIDYGYTLDCCKIGELVAENWNAGEYSIHFKGQTAHPMSSKGKLKNSILTAYQFIQMLPAGDRPEYTEGVEGYYWVKNLQGNVGDTTITLDIRDFSTAGIKARQDHLQATADYFNAQFGAETVTLNYRPMYQNVADVLADNPHVVDLAVKAMDNIGVKTFFKPMRGGFDGAALATLGIPVANLFCGAHHFHSIYEFLPENSLQKASDMVVEIMKLSVSVSK